MITKESLREITGDGRKSRVIKITFVSSDDNEKLDALNRHIGSRVFEYVKNLPCDGDFIALLSPNITYLDNDIISIRYDFTITSERAIVRHKRFCINMLLKQGIFLLPRFVSTKIRLASSNSFYLKKGEKGGIYAVNVAKNLEKGMKITRGREIDDFCDGKSSLAKIKIPHCLEAVRNNE